MSGKVKTLQSAVNEGEICPNDSNEFISLILYQ